MGAGQKPRTQRGIKLSTAESMSCEDLCIPNRKAAVRHVFIRVKFAIIWDFESDLFPEEKR